MVKFRAIQSLCRMGIAAGHESLVHPAPTWKAPEWLFHCLLAPEYFATGSAWSLNVASVS